MRAADFKIIIATFVLGLVGIMSWVIWYVGQEEYVAAEYIKINGEMQTELDVSIPELYPGSQSSYTLQLKAEEEGEFTVSLQFQSEGNVALAKYVDVEVRCGEKSAAKGKLSSYIDGAEITLPDTLSEQATMQLEIIYSMAQDVGDEAQGATADFKILLSARR